MNQTEWMFAGEVDAVAEDSPISVSVNGIAVGVYRLGNDVHAIEDLCPHADALLSQGFVDGEYVECPLHGALFHIPSGKCTKGPAERDVPPYETRIEGNKIFLRKLS
jgi:3-phenylpropionate/trans-cinnamate dioxygenase ferredoxin component